MKVLVTGSGGFVGKRLSEALREQGHLVKGFDLLLGNDLLSREQCLVACRGIDIVFHLAAILDEKSPLLRKVNVGGTENILEAASRARCKQFIYLSTAGVNAGVKGTVNEESEFRPKTGYEKSKAEAEKTVHEFHEMLPITVVRSALVFGPNSYWRQIIDYIRKGRPLVGSGKQVWQTIYVDDLVSALAFVLGKEDCTGKTFIVAEKEKHSLFSLYEEIRKQLGIRGKAKTVPVWLARIGALLYRLQGKKSIVTKEHIERLVRERNYDTSAIESLGWKPKTGMTEAVGKTLLGLKLE